MKTPPTKNSTLNVSIRSKEKLLYSGVAKTISSENESGPFDILPGHANFISLIFSYVILDRHLSSETSFDLEKGVMYVISDKVEIYVGI